MWSNRNQTFPSTILALKCNLDLVRVVIHTYLANTTEPKHSIKIRQLHDADAANLTWRWSKDIVSLFCYSYNIHTSRKLLLVKPFNASFKTIMNNQNIGLTCVEIGGRLSLVCECNWKLFEHCFCIIHYSRNGQLQRKL